MSEKRDTESTEIFWKLTYKHDSLLLNLWIVILWSFRICVLCGFIWIFYIAIQRLYESFGKGFWGIAPFVVISLLFAVVVFGYLMAILRTLNTKNIYATSKALIIEQLIGKDKIFEIGSFYFCDFSHAFTAIYADNTTISKFGEEVYNAYSFLDPLRSNNIQELYEMIKPQTQEYLSLVDERVYQNFKAKHKKIQPKFNLDFEKIDELRKSKNGK
ncbi:hypothetical protein [Helicobacter bilis]|uniref:Uncharacterized protein n=1 Tax=Helicobacter bilis TaxID=37372 RepID=A0A4U8U9H4_9HELI|nr:hypothetical protein [Helicobacter bilis]TLE07600.1 hypothetical protein LS78_008565 [Helicobacter bilis]TLE09192.1 hypothetical protein LS79_008420 [Helicobacter bilis]